MKYSTFKRIKILITSFVSATVAIAIVYNNMILAFAGVLIGILFLILVRKTTRTVLVDERVKVISGNAARLTYVVLTSVLGILSLMLILSGRRTGDFYTETLGIIFSYITLLSLAIYSMSYKYYIKKYGTKDDK